MLMLNCRTRWFKTYV